jgi:hypothetical protein
MMPMMIANTVRGSASFANMSENMTSSVSGFQGHRALKTPDGLSGGFGLKGQSIFTFHGNMKML